MPVPALIIAGTHSGCGKTTATLAILAALVRRGLRVQGFKVGPDFIDPGHHTALTGRPSRNLDTWLLDPPALAKTYRRGVQGADLAVIEGVMGLFDGRSALDEAGSTADLARRWGLPVILVVDACGLARSVAPLVRGFTTFDPAVRVAGVIANRVGGRRHFEDYLAPALRQSGAVEPIGYLVRDDAFTIPSRHLGLWTAEEFRPGSRWLIRLAEAAEATLDLDRLLALARAPELPPERSRRTERPPRRVRVALARDPAFCFYYEDNLDQLREAGADLIPFSPLDDAELPAGAELVYLGGGYPEVVADRLATNAAMRVAIRRFHAEGGTILAECGGMMACCRELRDLSGRAFSMWDLIPARVVMQARFAALGYVTVRTERPTPLGPAGTEIRGHEFHYSTLEPLAPLSYATHLIRPDRPPRPDGIQVGGLLAGYAHLHFGSNPDVARRLLST
ncbi:MAG: cobyrinate a,c-diamide synthase [Isosphaeraceae bacterium]|nr:cobyrinate a,c-diamide synthase [Isosphaeraceae bacterium]